MDIREMQTKKRKLQTDIKILLSKFEKETGVTITIMQVNRIDISSLNIKTKGQTIISDVTIETKL